MKALAKSLSKFHDLMGGLEKDGTNPHFKSKFITLDNILTSIKEPLKEAGLIYAQMPTYLADSTPALKTILIDIESGETISETSPLLLAKSDPQGQGSAITYMRRYALVSMLGLNTETDDDAEGALKRPQGYTGIHDENTDIDTLDMDERFNSAMNNDRV